MSEEYRWKTEENEEWGEEAMQNIVGFFALLLEVDRRINSENYKNNNQNYDRHDNN